jgi:MHS family alpha-ketoglutarate permease-like MFS transporter
VPVVSEETMDGRRRILAIVAASSGNLVEWFDFYVYAFTALYFAAEFFPAGNRTTQLLNATGVFAVGFVVRPIGGWMFGRIADRRGRRASMLVSVLMMCGGSLMMALLPTYARIGTAAPVLLLFARLVQGLSVGGEYAAAATYMSEVAVAHRRGFYASFQYFTLIGGQLLAVALLVVLQQILSPAELQAWGWRVPFAVGAAAALVALLVRRRLTETAPPEVRRAAHAGTLAGVARHPRSLLVAFGISAGSSVVFYTFTTYMQKYLVNTAGMSAKAASALMTAVLLAYMLLQPPFGALSDRIGRRNALLCFAALSSLTTIPVLTALAHVKSAPAAFALVMLSLTALSFYSSVGGLVKAELFPMEVRGMGVGLTHALSTAIFGGSAEYVALWLKSIGHERAFFGYVTAMCLVSLVATLAMPDTRRGGFMTAETER